jgi:flagellar biosynthetic protein FlhB
MAGENRTEKPTPKRREEARKKGQIARSMDLNAAVVLFASIATLALAGPGLFHRMQGIVATGLIRSGAPEEAGPQAIGGLAKWIGVSLLQTAGPVAFAAALAAFLANVAQVKLKLTPKAAAPSLRGLNPLTGIKRIFGPQGMFEGAKATVKTAVISIVALLALAPSIPQLAALVGLPPSALVPKLAGMVVGIAFRVAAAFLLVAIVDYAWQKRRHEKQLRMTKEEVKQEMRQHDIAPEVRGAIRRRQREQARRRMLAEVPTADVVVTNPTHYAVALRYDGSVPAPEVIAKGADLIAAQIRRVAVENGVPIMRNPPLARVLHDEVEIGRMIPERFYGAVAEVLAFVYRTAGRTGRAQRQARRRQPPQRVQLES